MKPIQNLVPSTMLLLLIACGGPPAPTDEEVRASLALEFPSYWKPVDFRILDSSGWIGGVGRSASAARFEASMELTMPTYVVRHQSVDELQLEQAGTPGDRVTLSGRARAFREGRGWAVQFFLDDNPTHRLGRTIESFSTDSVRVLSRDETRQLRIDATPLSEGGRRR